MIELILKDIEDPVSRENFARLSNFINRQVWFEGDFQLFDITIPSENPNFKIKHGLTFIPADIIPVAVEGNYNYYFKYINFDREYMYVNAEGPVRIRFLAGKLQDQIKNKIVLNNIPFVAPGDIVGPASPGFVYGAVGDKVAGFWLTSEGIPSNVVGVPVLFSNGRIVQVAVGTEVEADYILGIYQHEGSGLNLIELAQVPITFGGDKRVEINVPVIASTNVQLAVRLLSGNTRNLKVSLVLKGSEI